jgi:type II secretion system protein H
VRRSRGFTLIEILLVCMILAVLAALVGPRFGGRLTRSRLDSTARSIVALGRGAREHASADGRAYFLVLDPDKRTAYLERQRDPLAKADPNAPDGDTDVSTDFGTWSRVVNFDEGVSLIYENVAGADVKPLALIRIAFEPNGTVTTWQAQQQLWVTNDASMDLDDGIGDQLRIVVEHSSGLIRILAPEEYDAAVKNVMAPLPTTLKQS